MWRALLGRVLGRELVSSVALTAELLRIAASDLDRARVDHGDATLSIERDRVGRELDAILAAAVRGRPREYLDADTAGRLCDVLDRSPLHPELLALVAARTLDAHLGRAFVDTFRTAAPRRLAAGDPIPIVCFPSDRLAADEQARILRTLGRRTGDPRARELQLDRTDHLRLAPPAVAALRIRTVWMDPWLPPIRAETRFAAGITNPCPPREEFTWDEYVVGARRCFYGVAPRDPAAQQRRIAEVLAAAAAQRADIVVLPELCLTQEMIASLRPALEPLPLVIAGSYHAPVERGAPGANVCAIVAAGDRVHEHRKFSEYSYRDRTDRELRWTEHLERARGTSGFDLLIAGDCTAIVLLCKDALGHVDALIRELAPTLVLVPAMSDETDDFTQLAATLARDPQAFTVVACSGPDANVIYGRPNRDEPAIARRYDAHQAVILALSGIVSVGEQSDN